MIHIKLQNIDISIALYPAPLLLQPLKENVGEKEKAPKRVI